MDAASTDRFGYDWYAARTAYCRVAVSRNCIVEQFNNGHDDYYDNVGGDMDASNQHARGELAYVSL